MDTNDIIANVPKEVLQETVIRYLKPQEIMHLCQTSKAFNIKLCQSPLLWRALYFRDISSNPIVGDSYEKVYKNAYEAISKRSRYNINKYAARQGYEKLIKPTGVEEQDAAIYLEAVRGNHLYILKKYLKEPIDNINYAFVALKYAMADNNKEIADYILGVLDRNTDLNIHSQSFSRLAALYNKWDWLEKYNIPINVDGVLDAGLEIQDQGLINYALENGATPR